MTYYEWEIKIDGHICAQGTAPDQEGALNEVSLYLMQYQDDWKNKLEIIVKKKELNKWKKHQNQLANGRLMSFLT